jgi:hypothetical protein
MTGHVVTLPSASPHRTLRLVTDVDLPPGHHDRQREAEPTHNRVRAAGSLAACPRCQEVYAEARKVIEQAGGIAKWMEWVARP